MSTDALRKELHRQSDAGGGNFTDAGNDKVWFSGWIDVRLLAGIAEEAVWEKIANNLKRRCLEP